MRKVAVAMVVMALNLSPLVALAAPGGNGVDNGNGNHNGASNGNGGNSNHGSAPLPIVGVGIPGLALAGGIYLIVRRKRTNKA